MSYPDAKVEEYFKKFDADNSGELDKEEAKALVKELFPDFFKAQNKRVLLFATEFIICLPGDYWVYNGNAVLSF